MRAPWLRASSPTIGRSAAVAGAARHGNAVSLGARSISPAMYTNDGNCRRGATSPGATSCGTSNTRTRGSAALVSTYATAELVVPRSMPIRYRAGTVPILPRFLLLGDHREQRQAHLVRRLFAERHVDRRRQALVGECALDERVGQRVVVRARDLDRVAGRDARQLVDRRID